MAHAAYVAELVSKLCAPRQAELGVYDWLLAFLGALDRRRRQRRAPARVRAGPAGAPRLRPDARGLRGLRRRPAAAGGDDEAAFRWDPDRGGAVCSACGKRGRPIRAVVRGRWRGWREPGAAPAGDPLPADVNRGCRDAILEIIKLHINGPLLSLDFIAKMGGQSDGAPPPLLGIRHVALVVADLAAAERFWVDVMGYEVEWRPDADNVYLRGGGDNLALHRGPSAARGRERAAGPHRHRGGRAGRRRRLGRPPARARRHPEDRAEDPQRRLAVDLLPGARGAADPDHPPRPHVRIVVRIAVTGVRSGPRLSPPPCRLQPRIHRLPRETPRVRLSVVRRLRRAR